VKFSPGDKIKHNGCRSFIDLKTDTYPPYRIYGTIIRHHEYMGKYTIMWEENKKYNTPKKEYMNYIDYDYELDIKRMRNVRIGCILNM